MWTTAGGRNDMHRTDLNALAVIMRHTAKGQSSPRASSARNCNLSSPATTALIDRLDSSGPCGPRTRTARTGGRSSSA